MWSFYAAKREGNDLSSYQKKVASGMQKSREYMKSVMGDKSKVLTSLRAASPACILAMSDIGDLYNDYWQFGTTDTDPAARSNATEYNPMFAPQDGNMFLHYGTDPLAGFHLGASYAPLDKSSPLSKSSAASKPPTSTEIVGTAQREFNSWMKSFRSHCAVDMAKLRFFVGDAVALAYALQRIGASGSSKQANWYRDRYHFEPLDLNDGDYSDGAAPCMFDVIDTSNLIDHLGALNLLAATSPLLRNTFSSTLFSEKLVRTHGSHVELLEIILCGDLTTVSSLLGLTPVEVATNAAHFSSGDETIASGNTERTQCFARIGWKRPLNPTDTPEKVLSLIHFDPAHLASALHVIYSKMFADEDVTQMLARMTAQKDQRPSLPTYHRASFVALLCLVKSRVKTDWGQTMKKLLELIEGDEKLAFSHSYMQELFLWMHVKGLHSADILREQPGNAPSSQEAGYLQQWQHIPEAVCVTLQVPRSSLDPFIKESMKKGYTPPLQGTLQSSPSAASQWQNMFAATQVAFGSLTAKGTQSSESYEIEISHDPLGWSGKAAMFVSFYVPTWILFQEPEGATVSLTLPHTPHTVAVFASILGQTLGVFTAGQKDTGSVYITKAAPGQSGVISIDGFAPGTVQDEVNPNGDYETNLSASVDKDSGRISSFTSHVQILSEDGKASLKEGSKFTRWMRSPFHYDISPERGLKYRVNFPAPVLDSTIKIRVARKSSYLEVVANVAKSDDWPNFQSFTYPVFLDSGSPSPWNMPRLHLSSLPKIDVTDSKSVRLDFLKYHLPTMWSAKESALKFNSSLPSTPNLRAKTALKDSMYHMFIGFAGIEGKRASVFAINCAEEKGVQMVFFLSAMRLDLSNRTVVLDGAVLPLRLDLMQDILPSLQAMTGSSYAPPSINVDKDELQLWKDSLPAWSERSRPWSHKPNCEYLAHNAVPLSTRFGDRILCSCGEGELPSDFMPEFPGWNVLSKHAIRVSISPCFSSPLVESPLDIYKSGFTSEVPAEQKKGCQVCGNASKPDGSDLMRCSRCHVSEYCSKHCQKQDWKEHKLVCKP